MATQEELSLSEKHLDVLIDQFLEEFPPASTDPVIFLGVQFDRGLAWLHFPEGCGGQSLTPADQLYVLRRLTKAGAPSAMGRNVIGYGMCAPTIVVHGTEQQNRQQYPARRPYRQRRLWHQQPSAV